MDSMDFFFSGITHLTQYLFIVCCGLYAAQAVKSMLTVCRFTCMLVVNWLDVFVQSHRIYKDVLSG